MTEQELRRHVQILQDQVEWDSAVGEEIGELAESISEEIGELNGRIDNLDEHLLSLDNRLCDTINRNTQMLAGAIDRNTKLLVECSREMTGRAALVSSPMCPARQKHKENVVTNSGSFLPAQRDRSPMGILRSKGGRDDA
jgi:hypothetical protein